MVKENPVAGKKLIAFAIVAGHPVSVNFGGGVGASGMKRRRFILRGIRGPEHLTAGSLIEAGRNAGSPKSFENAGCPESRDVARVLREIETYSDVALGAKMVDLIRLDIIDQVGQLFRVRKIAVMKKETDIWLMSVLLKMIYSAAVQTARPADDPMDFVAFRKKEVRQIRAILARDSGNECFFHGLGFPNL